MLVTRDQIRAARALLDWTQEELANRSGLQVGQVRRFENGASQTLEILEALHKTLAAEGIEFIDEGIRRKKYEIRVLQGQKGFWNFFDDVYATIRDQGGEILVHNVDESLFVKWMGEIRWTHERRMHDLKNFVQKIIIEEGDMNFAAPYKTTEYRWAAKEEFTHNPFYLYGSKMAMVVFKDDDVTTYIIDQPDITASYRALFMSAWKRAQIPSMPPG